jgi:hypothetical protein
MHAMVSEQKQRAEQEGMVGHRLDTLLTMMGAEQERHAGQQNGECPVYADFYVGARQGAL